MDLDNFAALLTNIVTPHLHAHGRHHLEDRLLAVKSGLGTIELGELQWKEGSVIRGRALMAIVAAEDVPAECVDDLKPSSTSGTRFWV